MVMPDTSVIVRSNQNVNKILHLLHLNQQTSLSGSYLIFGFSGRGFFTLKGLMHFESSSLSFEFQHFPVPSLVVVFSQICLNETKGCCLALFSMFSLSASRLFEELNPLQQWQNIHHACQSGDLEHQAGSTSAPICVQVNVFYFGPCDNRLEQTARRRDVRVKPLHLVLPLCGSFLIVMDEEIMFHK